MIFVFPFLEHCIDCGCRFCYALTDPLLIYCIFFSFCRGDQR